jgi:hypothetical protein
LMDGPALLRFTLHDFRSAMGSSTAVATVGQLVMFVVDRVLEEDRRTLLSNKLESITLPDTTT